jgi:hypothetical protein
MPLGVKQSMFRALYLPYSDGTEHKPIYQTLQPQPAKRAWASSSLANPERASVRRPRRPGQETPTRGLRRRREESPP